jgi:hypothetical protein
VTSKSDHNAAGITKLQKADFNRPFLKLFVIVSFPIRETVTNVTLLEVITMKMVIESFKSPSLAGF